MVTLQLFKTTSAYQQAGEENSSNESTEIVYESDGKVPTPQGTGSKTPESTIPANILILLLPVKDGLHVWHYFHKTA